MNTQTKYQKLWVLLFLTINTPLVLADNCVSALSVVGGQNTAKFKAKDNAKDAWRIESGSQNGQKYVHWAKAKKKDVTCEQIGSFPNREWKCTATAIPCK